MYQASRKFHPKVGDRIVEAYVIDHATDQLQVIGQLPIFHIIAQQVA
jgi:hypothetical protein